MYFVAITTLWRCPCINSPRNDSLVPFVYTLAVSMKLPPASRKASYTFRASSFEAPQPQSSPKVIVPSAASETRSPLLPKSRYFTGIFLSRHASRRLRTNTHVEQRHRILDGLQRESDQDQAKSEDAHALSGT